MKKITIIALFLGIMVSYCEARPHKQYIHLNVEVNLNAPVGYYYPSHRDVRARYYYYPHYKDRMYYAPVRYYRGNEYVPVGPYYWVN